MAIIIAGATLLASCRATPDLAGLASGAVVGTATGSPALGYAVGLGVAAAGREASKWYGRSRQRGEQDAIASVAGKLQEGQSAAWRIQHTIPYGNENGIVQVIRYIATPLTDCREIAFSVLDQLKQPQWYASSICRHGIKWRWAEAEPAVERWGYLQ